MYNPFFTNAILEWYAANQRQLPWREGNDPYRVWLSEIILQQTRVAQGTPYFEKFVEKYPSVEDLAAASEDEVLRLWQGLGYYSRARNLHKCAKTIVEEYSGKFPGNYEQLLTLPGVGPYTAAAIASIGFGEPIPVVDGNVYRVLARAFNLEIDIAQGAAFKDFFELAGKLIDRNHPGQFNQGLMELGALVCTPANPACDECCISDICLAKKLQKQDTLPIKTKKTKKRNRYFTYLVLQMGNKIALRQRAEKDIWQGLHEFYLIETDTQVGFEELQDKLLADLAEADLSISEQSEPVKHVLSHQNLYTTFVKITLNDSEDYRGILEGNGLTLYFKEEADKLAKPILIANYLNRTSISIDL